MKQYIGNAIAIFMVLMMAMYGCKESTILNSNLLSTEDDINTVTFPDTLSIITRSVYDDSIVTSYNSSPVYAGLGTVNDPFFGRTSAGIVFQVVPPSIDFRFGERLPDSAVLILPYGGFSWGDTVSNVPQQFTVYALREQLSIDSNYYSTRKVEVDRNNPLGSVSGVTMSSFQTGDTRYLRIKLSNEFLALMTQGTDWMPADSMYVSLPRFLSVFKGFYVEPDTNSSSANTLYYFRLDGTSNFNTAGVVFYTADSAKAAFGFNPKTCAHYTWLGRQYSSRVLNYFNSTASADTILLQNEPGAAFDIVIPNIQSIPAALINKARLEITLLQDPQSATFTPPSRIYPIGIDEGGAAYNIADRLPLTSSGPLDFIDGRGRPVVSDGTSRLVYTINFPRELQQAILQGKNELRLRINGTQTFPGAYRLIAGGRNFPDPNYRLKLTIVYSKLN